MFISDILKYIHINIYSYSLTIFVTPDQAKRNIMRDLDPNFLHFDGFFNDFFISIS